MLPYSQLSIFTNITLLGTASELVQNDVSASSNDVAEEATSVNDQRLFALLAPIGNGNLKNGTQSNVTPALQPGGPKLRLSFGYDDYIRAITSSSLCRSDHLMYLFRFARLVLQDCERERSSLTVPDSVSAADEQMDAESIDTKLPCAHDFYSLPDMAALGGQCPVCLAALVLPLPQREFLFYKLSLGLVQAFRHLGIRLLHDMFTVSHESIWEQLTCSPTLWNREIGGMCTMVQAAAVYDQMLVQRGPIVHIYTGDGKRRFQLEPFPPPSPAQLKPLPCIAELRENSHVGLNFAFKRVRLFFKFLIWHLVF